jgi:hypothetical protein
MGLSDSHLRQTLRLFIPGRPPALSPGRSGSPRFLDASFRARSSQPPRGALQVLLLVSSRQVTGFVISGSLATPNKRNEAESDSLALGLTRSRSRGHSPFASIYCYEYRPASYDRLPSRRGPPLHGERVITKADTFQSARCTRLVLALQNRRISNIESSRGGQSVEGWFRFAQSFLKWTEFIYSTFDVGRSMFISFFFDLTGRSRPEAALNLEPLNGYKSSTISASLNLQSTLFRKIRTCLRVAIGRG